MSRLPNFQISKSEGSVSWGIALLDHAVQLDWSKSTFPIYFFKRPSTSPFTTTTITNPANARCKTQPPHRLVSPCPLMMILHWISLIVTMLTLLLTLLLLLFPKKTLTLLLCRTHLPPPGFSPIQPQLLPSIQVPKHCHPSCLICSFFDFHHPSPVCQWSHISIREISSQIQQTVLILFFTGRSKQNHEQRYQVYQAF
jgi:hypothetical protein